MASVSRQITCEPPPPGVADHFQSTLWAFSLFSDPTIHALKKDTLLDKPNYTGDTFMNRTLATEDTIAVWQSFYKPPAPGAFSGETLTIIKLGSGVNGHVDVCHGGFVSVLLDDVIGTAIEGVKPKGKSSMTASLKVDYKKPVRTPGVVLCRSWVEKVEGRKMWGRGTVEDGLGMVLAEGEALFLIVPIVTALPKL